MLAEKNVTRDDAYYVVAHLVRSVSALNQVIFALNEQYCINEKKAVRMIDTFDFMSKQKRFLHFSPTFRCLSPTKQPDR